MKSSPIKKPKKSPKPGTIWQLGQHRLAYGDCSDQVLIKKLVGKEKINLMCCDPPYGVAVVESKRNFKTLLKDKTVFNDHLQTDAEYRMFTKEWLEVVKPYLAVKNSLYVFNADKMIWTLREGLLETGFKVAQLLVWIKSQSVVGRMDYAPQHELILYGWYEKHNFRRSKDKSVLFCPRPHKSRYHPTTKPLSLIRRLILNSTEMNHTVFDGFLGSGTCLLVCEQIKRKCLAVEMDLEYCLTAIKRWEQLTGLKAKQI